MHRFYLPPEQCREPALQLSGPEAHHALHVLRVRRGERVTILDGAGHELLCDVAGADRNTVQLAVIQNTFVPPMPCQITLLQAIPRGKLFESIIQKATELGAHRIVPILSERVATRIDDAGAPEKTGKWRHAAIEAIKQCGSPWLPQIDLPVAPAQFLARNEQFDLQLIGSLEGERRHPREYLRQFHAQHRRPPASVCVWVGPEGDFTPAEVIAAKARGALPITLGRLVLRSDTAAIYCLSVLSYELQTETEH